MQITKLSLLLSSLLVSTAAFAGVEKIDTDVVVVGGGGTGVAAAAAAHQKGAKVILLEKLPFIGGSSAFSGGSIAAGGSKAQQRAGLTNTTPEGYAQIWLNDQKRSFPGGDKAFPNEQKVRKITNEFTKTVDWIEESIGHPYADPRPFGYGGPKYAHSPKEAPVPASGRGSSPAGGRFVIQNFKKYLNKEGVPIMTATPVTSLITNSKGDVVGVKAKKGDTEYEINAKAVVLATGGFARNKEMMKKYVPSYAPYTEVSVATMGATGDGIKMAQKVGADSYKDAWVIGLYAGAAKKSLEKTFTNKNKYKDCVFVNENGKRFVNENLPYLTDPIAAQKAVWAITDSSDAAKVLPLKEYNDPKIAVGADSWQALAKKIGVPAKNLERTMKLYNDAATSGKDSEFNKPKEHILPFTKAPFYAIRVVPQTGGTMGGVVTNDKFQVLRPDGSVIKGLYAGGETTNRPYYNRVYTSGSGLGVAYTSGRIAGENAAEEK